MKKEETKVVVDVEKEYEELTNKSTNVETSNPVNPFEIKDVTSESKKNSNTKKIIAIVTSVIVVICLAVGIWFIIEKNVNKWELKQNEVTIEYGEVYEPSLSDLVDIELYPSVTDDNTEIKVNVFWEEEVPFKDVNFEGDKGIVDLSEYATGNLPYPVGDFDIDVIHKAEYKLFGVTIFSMNDTKKVKLSIRDTIAPVFTEDAPTSLETYKDCEIENIEEKFKATDKATVSITIDEIDYSTAGEYTVNVYATDANGNVTNKEIKVKVLEPTTDVDKTSLNMKVGATDTITATVKGKSQEVNWTSTDESVAKVENGTVTALKEGTTTIEAEANGVKASINITVAKVEQRTPASNNNNPSSSNNGGSYSKPSSNNGNNNSSNNNGGTSSNSSNSSTNSSYYCDEGGSHHRRDVGQIGWCSTPEEAQKAVSQYLTEAGTSGGFTITKCSCGKYTAYIN